MGFSCCKREVGRKGSGQRVGFGVGAYAMFNIHGGDCGCYGGEAYALDVVGKILEPWVNNIVERDREKR